MYCLRTAFVNKSEALDLYMWSICCIPKLTMENLMVMSNWTIENRNPVEIFIHYVCKNTSPHNPERLTVHVLVTDIAEISLILGWSSWGHVAPKPPPAKTGASEKEKRILV